MILLELIRLIMALLMVFVLSVFSVCRVPLKTVGASWQFAFYTIPMRMCIQTESAILCVWIVLFFSQNPYCGIESVPHFFYLSFEKLTLSSLSFWRKFFHPCIQTCLNTKHNGKQRRSDLIETARDEPFDTSRFFLIYTVCTGIYYYLPDLKC